MLYWSYSKFDLKIFNILTPPLGYDIINPIWGGGCSTPKTHNMASKHPQISWLFLFLYNLSDMCQKWAKIRFAHEPFHSEKSHHYFYWGHFPNVQRCLLKYWSELLYIFGRGCSWNSLIEFGRDKESLRRWYILIESPVRVFLEINEWII